MERLLLPENDAANDVAAVVHQLRPEFAARIDVVDIRFIEVYGSVAPAQRQSPSRKSRCQSERPY